MEKKWYVYSHIRIDKNEIFYIGVGSIKNYARAFSKRSRNKYWRNIVNKTEYSIEIIRDELYDYEAKEIEIRLIQEIGRYKNGGTLCNLTDGGDGMIGYSHTEETKRVIREKRKNQVFSIETLLKLGISRMGNINALGKKHKEELNISKSNSQRGKYGRYVIRKDLDNNIIEFSGIKDAADSVNTNYKNIWYYIKNNKIYKGFYWSYKGVKPYRDDDILTKEFLYNEYIINKKSGQKIAEDINCSGTKVYRFLKIYGLREIKSK